MSTTLIDKCALSIDELDHCLERTHLVFRGLVEQADRLLAERGLGRAHQRVLWVVARQPDLPTGVVAGFLGISVQALHKTMRELIDHQLIQSTTDTENRRLRRVGLTDAGRKLEAQLTEPQRAVFAVAVNRLGPEAIAQWGSVMDTLAAELGSKASQDSTDLG